jgi:hypothetical protein
VEKKDIIQLDREQFNKLLDKFIDRSERWMADAEEREDYMDVFYYHGQRHVIEELKDMVKNFK